jgi:hypothetical protein
MAVASVWGGGKRKSVVNGYGVSVWSDEKPWRWMVVTVAQQCKILNTPEQSD